MNFKNELERRCFEVAERALGKNVAIQHNKTVKIESALFPEVAAFKGPPAKEIDVLVATLHEHPKIVLLVSCKLLSGRAEPAHVQEWAAVVQTMNKYSHGTTFFGLILSPTGFTSGSEAWATSHNIGLLPPLKGRRLTFNEDTVLRMFGRVLKALHTRVLLRVDDLMTAPAFFDFVFRLSADYEGHHEATADARYFLVPQNWVSSFGEMYAAVAGRIVEDIFAVEGATVMKLSGGMIMRFDGCRVEVGPDPSKTEGTVSTPQCWKNVDMEQCSIDVIKVIAIGRAISSAGDFATYIEFGLDQCFNLGIHQGGFHLFSTENPIEEHRI